MARNILSQAVAMGVKDVSLSGGEPLLWPGIVEVASLCRSAGINVEVYTSGNVDSPELSLEELKANGISKIIFSLYGPHARSHDEITQVQGSFDRTMTAVEKAMSLGLPVEFHFVPLSINYMHLSDVADLATSKHIPQVSVLRFVPQGRGQDCAALTLDDIQNQQLKEAIESRKSGANVRVGSPYNFLMVNDSPKCRAGEDRLTILPDSTIYPCDAFKQIKAKSIVGTDVFSRLDTWSLRECWERSPYLHAVRTYLAKPFSQPCARCKCLKKCLSGCAAQKYLANGEMTKTPDPMCLRCSPLTGRETKANRER